ncbi:50S ribosomal protein L31e [Candidatus Micrarchaeota archaeon]|nr:50S ribosomal protein L31e [Candidatus Micrarchaeota archaeon]
MAGGEQPKPEKALEKIQKTEEQVKAKEEAVQAEQKAVEKAAAPAEKLEAKAEAKKEERKAEAAKKPEKGKEEKKREIVLERNYVIPLIKAYETTQTSRGNKAVKMTKAFLARHMKAGAGKIKLDPALSAAVFARGSKRPPKKLRVNASKDKEGLVWAKLAPA